MECRKRKRAVECLALWLFLSWKCWIVGAMELTYSIAEELQPGSVVGNIAKDLGLDLAMITERNLQVVMDSGAQYFEVNGNGALVIKHTIDRERLCELNSVCTLNVRIMLQNPSKIFRVVVLVEDVNDNAPQFPTRNISLEISEAAMPGARFRLESAQDPDVGTNSLRTYLLSSNDCFVLNVVTKSDGSKFPELVLEKALDREKQATFQLLLTALDGGRPEKSGTSLVVIKVLDVNDNAPVFGQPTKKVSLLENSPPGTLVTKLNATDADSGLNGEISFMFSKYTPERILKLFSVDSVTGEVQVTGEVDFEVANVYDITVQARDKGSPAMEGSCNIKVEVTDVNDNTPVLTLNLLMNPIKEDTEPGTVVAFINVEDEDSGKNAEVTLHIGKGLPFKLMSSFGDHYTVVTEGHLDRETQSEYTIVVTATDSGSPPLSSKSTFTVSLADVNDNAPVFSQPSYMAEVAENNAPGVAILTVSASDRDAGENARLSFSVLESAIDGVSVSSYVYVDPEEGHIRAMRSLDHERLKAFQLVVQAKDAGTPPRAANVTVHVFVVDENDNVPAVVYPVFPAGSTLRLTAPRHAPAGFFLSRIVAVDPDSGHNAWLLYSISPGQHSSLFRVGPHTGELRTARRLSKEEEDEHREEGPVYNIVVVVQDNGSPSLSTTVAVSIVVEEKDLHISTNTKGTSPNGGLSDMTLYLIVSLGCVSAVSFLTFMALMVWCLRHRGDHTDNCCIPRRSLRSRHVHRQPSQKNLQLRLNTDGPIKYVEVVGQHPEVNTHTYRPCYSTLSSRSDFVFVKTPMMSHDTLSMTLSRKHLVAAANEQKPPNADWRFSQNQRPGPSGAGPRPEESGAMAGTGPWPNPPTEAEQLQALMAAANEVSEATATLTPGTMGLSTRYGPQFTLQHVPDYRQNVYIPGSTATLTANQQQALPPAQPQPQPQPAPPAQTDAPKAAQTPASKKKSAKKEKK